MLNQLPNLVHVSIVKLLLELEWF